MRIDSHGFVVNRLCGSGFQAVVSAAHEILLGEADVVVAAGAESMSQAPYVLRGVRWGTFECMIVLVGPGLVLTTRATGTRLGQDQKLEDSLWAGLTDQYVKVLASDIGAQA
jgi:acetyl-CoA acyltransferase 2